MREIIEVTIEIDDRGQKFPIKPIEVQGNVYQEVKNYLSKYKHAFGFSNSFKWEIIV